MKHIWHIECKSAHDVGQGSFFVEDFKKESEHGHG